MITALMTEAAGEGMSAADQVNKGAALPAIGTLPPRRDYGLLRAPALRILGRMGWSAEGVIPDCPRVVVAVAPHSSNWDFVVGAAMMIALELRVSFIAKHTLFRWPMGWFMRWLGGIPIDRAHPEGFADQMIGVFGSGGPLWLAVAPEGTRRAGAPFKSGFYRIAQAAQVPILPVYFNHRRRVIGFLPLIEPVSDAAAGIGQVRDQLLLHGARRERT
ncbi:MAG: 1-acyl-sn-glycerol-3-phosphate acyltransferase [Burkholderiales bacterium]